MKAYRIVNWERFEKSDHKKCKNMTWVATPTSHDGIGFLTLLTLPEGLRKYGGWHLILQTAAKCPSRGLLVSDAGRPIGPREIALKTRASESDITDALDACLQIKWIEEVEITSGVLPESSGDVPVNSCLQDSTVQDSTGEERTPRAPRRKGMEVLKATLEGLGLPAKGDAPREWSRLAGRRASCRDEDEALEFIGWAVKRGLRDGKQVSYAKHAAIYADEWRTRSREAG